MLLGYGRRRFRGRRSCAFGAPTVTSLPGARLSINAIGATSGPEAHEEETALLPTGKPYPDEPSGDVAVQSDSALPNPAVSKVEPGSASDLTTDLTPGPPAEPATKWEVPVPPAAFGRYQVRNALGAGGFGAVYLGHDTQLDRPVAIKVLRGGPEVPQAEAERFLQEARRLAQLRHPGIVAVHDVGVQEGQVYIVSDYLDGPDLGRWLRDHRPTWPEAALVAAAVADALAHAHTRLIIHRDVKPANILLTTDRGAGPRGLRPGPRRDPGAAAARKASSLALRGTCRRSKPPAQPTGSTAVPTSTAWVWCFTKSSQAACPSGPPTSRNCCGRCVMTSRSPLDSSSATSHPSWKGPASRRWRSGSRTATPPQGTSPRTCAGSSRPRQRRLVLG